MSVIRYPKDQPRMLDPQGDIDLCTAGMSDGIINRLLEDEQKIASSPGA
jgi:hypothetical protein